MLTAEIAAPAEDTACFKSIFGLALASMSLTGKER
jgi:hypothetical protein